MNVTEEILKLYEVLEKAKWYGHIKLIEAIEYQLQICALDMLEYETKLEGSR
jgi:hypothetical protein